MTHSRLAVSVGKLSSVWRMNGRYASIFDGRARIRTNPGVFARLRSFAFNILKSHKTSTLSQDRYRAALGGIDNLLQVLAIP